MEHYEDPERIHGYEYSAQNDSLIDRYLLHYWWKLAIHVIPRRMPANLVSMVGNLGSWFAFLVVSGILFGPMPMAAPGRPWLFGLAALGLAFYQTFDALDGIQARRTGSSGPLGEFVDHWFDSFNGFLIPLGLTFSFPDIPAWLCLLTAWFTTLADWSELRRVKETNTIRFGKISSEEGQVALILFYLVVWMTGYTFWTLPIPGLGLSPTLVIVAIGGVIGFVTSLEPLAAYRFVWLPDLFAEFVSLAPIAVWALLAEPALGRAAIIAGSLCIGFGGSRYAGDLLRSRLFGLAARRWYPDFLVLDAILILSVCLPGLPSWAPIAAIAAYGLWLLAALALQFSRSLKRVRQYLGVRLFALPERNVTL
jgi:phosphatidylglycerophosphate synthase